MGAIVPAYANQGKAARRVPRDRGSMSRARQRDNVSFMGFIDDQIAAARENIMRAQNKLAVLEELRRDYSENPSRFTAAAGTLLPPRQLLATQAIATYLNHQADPVPTTTLLRFLEEQGIKFGGRNPRNSLSVLLSRSKQFIAHGRRGWTVDGEGET